MLGKGSMGEAADIVEVMDSYMLDKGGGSARLGLSTSGGARMRLLASGGARWGCRQALVPTSSAVNSANSWNLVEVKVRNRWGLDEVGEAHNKVCREASSAGRTGRPSDRRRARKCHVCSDSIAVVVRLRSSLSASDFQITDPLSLSSLSFFRSIIIIIIIFFFFEIVSPRDDFEIFFFFF
jgi:hypothetical protein